MTIFEKAKITLEEKEKKYGKLHQANKNLARIWEAMVSEHNQTKINLPPYLCSLMLVAMKVFRASKPTGLGEDNYIDSINYLVDAYTKQVLDEENESCQKS